MAVRFAAPAREPSMDQTPNLNLPYILAAQAQKHVTHNEAIRMLDALTQIGVASRVASAPPATPPDGVRYILPAAPTGVWAGPAGRVAAFQDGAWAYFTPHEGWIAWVADEAAAVVYAGGSWVALTGASASTFATLGINATADTTNRLTVSAPATLLNHAGAGHQVKVNKAAAAATASLLYQTAFSGRAEMGLTGDDNFHVKVSPDGATWREAMVITGATGRAVFPAGGVVTSTAASVTINVPAQAASIQAALDALNSTRFEGSAQGIIAVAPGAYALAAPLVCRHPQPGRIVLRAANAATLPVEADFTGTKTADEAMVRGKYTVIVEGANVSALTVADGEGIGLIQDIAFIRTGTTGTPIGAFAIRRGRLVMDRCALFGFLNNVQCREGGGATLTNCQLAYSANAGISIDQGGEVKASTTLVASSGGTGIELRLSLFSSDGGLRVKSAAASALSLASGSKAQLASANLSGNAFQSAVLATGCALEAVACTMGGGAGQAALVVSDGSAAVITTVTVAGDATQRSLVAQRGSILATAGPHTGTPVFSPAIGTTGNSGAWTF